MTSRRKPRLIDVARLAGVSQTTVSYILNDRAGEMRISATTEERVRRAMAELGYVPNRSAQSLRTRRTRTIGVVSDFIASGAFGSQMLSGVSTAARSHQHAVVIGETGGDPRVELGLIREFLERDLDGIVYAKLVTAQCKPPAELLSTRTVLLNAVDEARIQPSVVPDEEEGGRTAARLVASSGPRVAIVGLDPTVAGTATVDRVRGIESELGGVAAFSPTYLSCDWKVPDAYEVTARWLARGGRSDSIICLNDRIAMGVYQALDDVGLRAGRDLTVVSFDGSELASWLRPQVTTVVIPYAEMGMRAVDLLLQDEPPGAQVLLTPMPVRHGGSILSGVPVTGDTPGFDR